MQRTTLLAAVFAITASSQVSVLGQNLTLRDTLRSDGKTGVLALAFSPDGKTLASGAAGRAPACDVRLWDVATGMEKATLEGHRHHLFSLAFSPDGKTLASASFDETVRLWDPATGKERRVLRPGGPVMAVSFSHDGKLVATGGSKGAQVWDAASGNKKAHREGIGQRGVAFSPVNNVLATTQGDLVTLWNLDTDKTVSLFGHKTPITRLAFSPDGKWIAAGSTDVRIWDPATNAPVAQFAPNQPVNGLAFSTDSKSLASGGVRGALSRWDRTANKELPRFELRQPIYSIAFSPDGKTMAVGMQGEIHLYEFSNAQPK